MKKLSFILDAFQSSVWCMALLLCALPSGAYAQDTPANDMKADKVDSLTQVVNELSSKVQKVEDDKRNEAIWKKRSKYFGFGYVNQTLTNQDIPGLEWKSDIGISLNWGRTFYLHKKPLFNMLKFGLDFTWMDISYAKYSAPKGWVEEPSAPVDPEYPDESDDDIDLGMHQMEFGLHVGPSITVNPVNHLKVNTYFHFVPSGSVVILNDEANASYVSNFAVGGAIAYKAISLGIESRWGKAKYNSFTPNDDFDMDDDSDLNIDDAITTGKQRLKTKSLRFYLTLRF